ncbi:MAG: hypothetical protein RIT28_1269 [Pseudomonadota bacterium]
MLHRSSALIALVLSGCYVTPGEETCTSNPLPEPVETECNDADDLDNDDIADCDDTDIDGDGLRNLWDCSPLDPTLDDPHTGGRCEDPNDRDDGDLVVPLGTSLEWDPPNTVLRSDANRGNDSISVASGAAFNEGDEILILNQQGAEAGTYEVALVAKATSSTLTIEPPLKNAYDSDDLVRVQRVPHYDEVNVEGTLTARAWDAELGGGVVMFRVCGAVSVPGLIDMDGLGFAGGQGVSGNDNLPTTGESWNGPSVHPENAADETEEYEVGARNGGGGGAPVGDVDALRDQNAGGAGGSLATTGEYSFSSDGEKYAQPGEEQGTPNLESWFMGSGGGAGAPDREEDGDSALNVSGNGGPGGGLVAIFAKGNIAVSGGITAKGQRGQDARSEVGDVDGFPVGGEPGGGGGGSGGTMMVVAELVQITAVGDNEGLSVRWGEGGWPASGGVVVESDVVRGGLGGYGYLRVDAANFEAPGNISTANDGPHLGDFTQWCWTSDELPERPCYTDDDGDGVVAWACGGGDCDDSDADINPDAAEIMGDSLDQNCDGLDLCDIDGWYQGGLKTGSCSIESGAQAGATLALGIGLSMLRRRRSRSA